MFDLECLSLYFILLRGMESMHGKGPLPSCFSLKAIPKSMSHKLQGFKITRTHHRSVFVDLGTPNIDCYQLVPNHPNQIKSKSFFTLVFSHTSFHLKFNGLGTIGNHFFVMFILSLIIRLKKNRSF